MTREVIAGRVFLRAIGVLGAFQAGVMLANLIRVKLVAVEVGPTGVGLQTLIDQIVVFVSLGFTFSMPFAAVKYLSYAHDEEGRAFARAFAAFRRVLTVMSLVGLAAAGTLALVAPDLFGGEVADNADLLLIALAAIPVVNLMALVTQAIAASGRATTAAALTLAHWTMVAVLAGGGLLLDGLRGYFIGVGAATGLVLVAGGAYLRRAERTQDRGGRVRTLAELRRHPGVLRFALVQSVLTLTTPLAYLVARYAVLGDGGLEDAGLLAASLGIAQALTSLLNPANALLLTPALNLADPPEVKLGHMLEYRRAALAMLAVGMLPALLFPEVVLRVLFDAEFVPASDYVYLFVLSEAFVVVSAIHQALLIGLDDFAVNVTYVLVGQLVMVVLIVVLVPGMGVAGVGVAMIGYHALVLALTTRRLWRRHRMATRRGLGGRTLGLVAGLAAIGAIVPTLPSDDPLLIVVRAVLLALLAAAGSVLAYRATAPIAGKAS